MKHNKRIKPARIACHQTAARFARGLFAALCLLKETSLKFIRIHYLDASAIVKLILNEPGSSELRQYFGKESNFTATSLCFVESLAY